MTNSLSIGISLLAGLVSFLSPCVLPLIPGFLSYLAGTSVGEASKKRGAIFLTSVFFVLGFGTVFASLGVLLNSVLQESATEVQLWLSRIGGSFIILFGLFLTGLLQPAFLEREYKFQPKWKSASKNLTAFIFGASFAAGWTPCVGPVLGSIISLAAAEPGSAFTLLLAYSIGLGIPFLAVGLFANQASSFIKKWGSRLRWVNILFGVLLILIGILVFTENLDLLANFSLLNSLLKP